VRPILRKRREGGRAGCERAEAGAKGGGACLCMRIKSFGYLVLSFRSS
jgi:hypothetical protein